MFREDYNRLKEVFTDNQYFELISPAETKDSVFKVMKLQSKSWTYYDVLGEGFSQKKYLYLDMLPIDFVPENDIVRKLKGLLFRALDLSHNSSRCYTKYTPHLTYMSKESKELKKNLWIRRIVGFPAYIIGPSNMYKYPFEGLEFYGPNDADSYLTNRYGDYMTPPEKKEQTERHVRLKDNWVDLIERR